ncbi:MAG: DUF2948 family protein [Holosporaceae bacterium]|nr:DUF2948 family protein [Holosporaceae bacterium]
MRQDRLLLKVEDFEGCDLISSLLQDSIFHISLHFFHEKKKRFHLMLNRFCWEHAGRFDKNQCYYRVHSGLYIHHVDSIFAHGSIEKEQYLNLLTFHSSRNEINMVFSGSRHICINISNILVYLKDLHDMYPTMAMPMHS